jgi:putative copper export protein
VGTHAAASPGAAILGVFANGVHLAGVAIWVGGLAGLVAVRALLRGEDAQPLARHAFAGFSLLAGYAIALVIGGGAILAVLLVGSWEALVATGYGWVVLGKVSLVVPMIALGAFNRYRLMPRTADGEPSATAVRTLARNVRAEVSLGAVILVLSAPPMESGWTSP